jgi:hypothetical protein
MMNNIFREYQGSFIVIYLDDILVFFFKPLYIKTDIFDFAIGRILSQPNEIGVVYLVAYYLCKFIAPKAKYPIYDKKLLIIIVVFEK